MPTEAQTSEMPVFVLFDGEGWSKFATLKDAAEAADEAIEAARDACDPEWPFWVAEIRVFSAPPGCDDPEENGRLVLYAKEVDIEHDADPEAEGVDYWCDYVMTETPDAD